MEFASCREGAGAGAASACQGAGRQTEKSEQVLTVGWIPNETDAPGWESNGRRVKRCEMAQHQKPPPSPRGRGGGYGSASAWRPASPRGSHQKPPEASSFSQKPPEATRLPQQVSQRARPRPR
ncbi:hypothetical protein ZWY2020_023900 [Hordeum vulgare]|nr:hypothetical protein ZWY2020_023900 [Hordeum vulgare]